MNCSCCQDCGTYLVPMNGPEGITFIPLPCPCCDLGSTKGTEASGKAAARELITGLLFAFFVALVVMILLWKVQ